MFTPNTRLCYLFISHSGMSTRQLIFIDIEVNIHTQLLLLAITGFSMVNLVGCAFDQAITWYMHALQDQVCPLQFRRS